MTDMLRSIRLWALALLLAGTSVVLPRLLNLNDHFAGGFFTAEAYGMSAGLLLSGIILGVLDPRGAVGWALVLGAAPLADMAVRMASQGPGNLWPVAIALALMLGIPPAIVGALVGRKIRQEAERAT